MIKFKKAISIIIASVVLVMSTTTSVWAESAETSMSEDSTNVFNEITTKAMGGTYRTTGEDIFMRPIADFGWTTFKISWNFSEDYEVDATGKYLKCKDVSVLAESSRPSFQNPFSFNVFALDHYNSSDNCIGSFNMTSYPVWLPTDLWHHYCKRNSDTVGYPLNSQNYGRFVIHISSDECLFPYNKVVRLNLY